MKFIACAVGLVLFAATIALAEEESEAALIERQGDTATIRIDHPRPLDAIAIALADNYQLHVNAEDPSYLFREDVVDVTSKVARSPNPQRRVLVPKGGRFEVTFTIGADGRPLDPAALLRRVVGVYNRMFATQYRLNEDGDTYTFVPVKSRDTEGRLVPAVPLLDHRISITRGRRTLQATFGLVSEALSERTGSRVDCCSPGANNYFLQREIDFEAHDEPARDVILRITKKAAYRYQWLVRVSPHADWWFINLRPLVRRGGDSASGDFYEEHILWPDAKPLPPIAAPVPPISQPEAAAPRR